MLDDAQRRLLSVHLPGKLIVIHRSRLTYAITSIFQFSFCFIITLYLTNLQFIESKSLKLLSCFKCKRFVFEIVLLSIRNSFVSSFSSLNLLFPIVLPSHETEKLAKENFKEEEKENIFETCFSFTKLNNKNFPERQERGKSSSSSV